MGKGSHSAAPNAIGYQHQTWWALVELLHTGASRPDAAITLELYDDVAWEREGSATDLLQVKHHIGQHRTLTDTATDVWRTLKVWLDEAAPADADGPALALVTTETAGDATAVAALRPHSRNETEALRLLEHVARTAQSKQTKEAREQLLALGNAARLMFVSRIRVIDRSPHIQDSPASARLPSGGSRSLASALVSRLARRCPHAVARPVVEEAIDRLPRPVLHQQIPPGVVGMGKPKRIERYRQSGAPQC